MGYIFDLGEIVRIRTFNVMGVIEDVIVNGNNDTMYGIRMPIDSEELTYFYAKELE